MPQNYAYFFDLANAFSNEKQILIKIYSILYILIIFLALVGVPITIWISNQYNYKMKFLGVICMIPLGKLSKAKTCTSCSYNIYIN